jgi:transposase-like protein
MKLLRITEPMGDRFYQQQLETLGRCPGSKSTTKRKRRMAWDDDKKAAVIAAYEEANPTPETSMEVVKEIADEFEESANGVRMILSKAGVYIKKTPAASGSGTSSSGGSSRVSKAAAQETLIAALTDAGAEIDNDIVEKLIGKAAQYFAGVITQVNG